LEENKITFPKANMHKLECLYTLFIKNTTTPEENISELHGAERAQ
jgi:hypothetical protein